MQVYTLVAALSLGAAALGAQTAPGSTPARRAEVERLRIVTATEHRSQQIRAAGVSDTDLRSFIDMMTRSQITPTGQLYILTAERDAARTHGPTDNFGAFVQGRLDAGLRGRALAIAIHREHRQHGKGVPAKALKGERAKPNAGDRVLHDRGRDTVRHVVPAYRPN